MTNTTAEPVKYLNKKQVAEILGVSTRTVTSYMSQGKIGFVKITQRKVVFDEAKLREHISCNYAIHPQQ